MKRRTMMAAVLLVASGTYAFAQSTSVEEDAQIAALLALVQRGAAKGAKQGLKPEDSRSLTTFIKEEQRKLKARAQQSGGQYIAEASEPDRPWIPWSASYEAIRPTNPLVTKQCQDEAIEYASALRMKERGTSPEKHFLDQIHAFKQGALGARDYFDHLVVCRSFCAQIVARLLNCHLDAIATLPPEDTVLVLFGVGRSSIPTSTRRHIRKFAQKLATSDKKVLLFGSASRLNARDSAAANETLSRHRAEAVRRALISAGIDDDRIFITWIGQDPPRISERDVARRLGFGRPWNRLKRRGRAKYMDQNVLAVAWSPGEPAVFDQPASAPRDEASEPPATATRRP